MMKLPEPWGRMDQRGRLLSDNDPSGAKLYTEAQYRQGQRDALEAAAKVCDPDELMLEQGDDAATGVYRVEKAIRKLMEGL